MGFQTLTQVQNSILIAPFLDEEILAGIISCVSTKAPEPDGLNFLFYKNAWGFTKNDFISVFKNFHRTGKLSKGISSSFMVLIPKDFRTRTLSEFRPISLINGIYKMVSKVLSFRLHSVLSNVIAKISRLS